MYKRQAREYAPDGINVNAVMPGLTYTPMTAGMPDWKREAIEDSTLVKHGGQPYDIARAIVFLADPESGYICLLYTSLRWCRSRFRRRRPKRTIRFRRILSDGR